jgi:quercetin dioxygenase-like cupin family protein
MPAPCVLQTSFGSALERPGVGPQSGFDALEQSLLALDPGAAIERATGEAEEVLFVVAGGGTLRLGEKEHPLGAESGAYVAPGETYEIVAGRDGLRLVSVRVPDPEPAAAPGQPRSVVRRLEDQEAQDATTDRQFRIVADPSTGLRSATHFVGYIPTVRAAEHFHTYDEAIYVLEGEGAFHAQGASTPVGAGTCIALPARVVHCLENTGPDTMRVVAVFRPAGSPAAAYYPDGTPAFPGLDGREVEPSRAGGS